MASHLSKEENQVHTLGTLLAAGEDKSWKVRLCFAKSFAKFAEAFGKEISDNNLIQTFTLLLNDNEPEVKNAAITSLSPPASHANWLLRSWGETSDRDRGGSDRAQPRENTDDGGDRSTAERTRRRR